MRDSYVKWHACAHGLRSDLIGIRDSEDDRSLWIDIAEGLGIRVQMVPHSYYPGEHAVDLESDRKGLLRLAEVASEAARRIKQQQEREP